MSNDRNARFDDIFGAPQEPAEPKIDEMYRLEDSRKFNVGRMLKDAGVRTVNAAVFAAYKRGEIEVAPDLKVLIDAAIRHNERIDAQAAAVAQTSRFVSRERPSEWDLRGSKDGE